MVTVSIHHDRQVKSSPVFKRMTSGTPLPLVDEMASHCNIWIRTITQYKSKIISGKNALKRRKPTMRRIICRNSSCLFRSYLRWRSPRSLVLRTRRTSRTKASFLKLAKLLGNWKEKQVESGWKQKPRKWSQRIIALLLSVLMGKISRLSANLSTLIALFRSAVAVPSLQPPVALIMLDLSLLLCLQFVNANTPTLTSSWEHYMLHMKIDSRL